MTFIAPSSFPTPGPSRAATIRQTHRFLLALAEGERPDWRSVPRPALHWLEDRQLILPVRGQAGLDYALTTLGLQRVLGLPAV